MVLLEVYLQGIFLEVGWVKGRCLCSFVRYCHISLLKGCTELIKPIFPKSHQQSLSCFLVFASLIGKKLYLGLVFIYISLWVNLNIFLDIWGPFIYLVFVNCLFIFFSIPCPSILRVLYTLRILTSCLWNILPTFSFRLSFVFDFVYGVFFFCHENFKKCFMYSN